MVAIRSKYSSEGLKELFDEVNRGDLDDFLDILIQTDFVIPFSEKDLFIYAKENIELDDYQKDYLEDYIYEEFVESYPELLQQYDVDMDTIFMMHQSGYKEKSILTIPSKEEIEKNILVKGDAFYLFMNETEVNDLKCISDNKKIINKKNKFHFSQLADYYKLIGSIYELEFYLDFNIEDYDLDDKIELSVLNMKQFYKKHNFKVGDGIIIKCLDWWETEFELQYISAAELAKKQKELSKEDLWSELINYNAVYYQNAGTELEFEVIEKIRRITFDKDCFILTNPYFDIMTEIKKSIVCQDLGIEDEYLTSQKIYDGFQERDNTDLPFPINEDNLFFPNQENELVDKFFDDELFDKLEEHGLDRDMFEENQEAFEESMKEPINNMCQQMGFDFNLEEIEGYILDDCYCNMKADFNRFYERLFDERIDNYYPHLKNNFIKELKNLWKKTTKNYNRFQDKNGKLRRDILKVSMTFKTYLRKLDSNPNLNIEALMSDAGFKEAGIFINMMVHHSNQLRPGVELDLSNEDFAKFKESVEVFTENIEDILADILEQYL